MSTPITVSIIVHAPIEKVWGSFTKPEHITGWAFASDDWESPEAENDVSVGGRFKTVMRAKDGSTSFDFTGTYTTVILNELITYTMNDGRHASVRFTPTTDGVEVTEIFDPESTNPEEMQRGGWLSILESFKKYTEGKK